MRVSAYKDVTPVHPGGHFSFDLIAEPASYSLNTRDLICIFNQCSNRVRQPLVTKPSPCFPCLSIRLAREDPIPSGGIRSAGTSERNSIFAISPDCHQNQEGKAPRLFSSDSSSLSNPKSSLFRHLPLPFPSFFPPLFFSSYFLSAMTADSIERNSASVFANFHEQLFPPHLY